MRACRSPIGSICRASGATMRSAAERRMFRPRWISCETSCAGPFRAGGGLIGPLSASFMKHLLPPAVGVVVSAVRDFVDALADLGKRVDEASRRLEKAAAASRQHVYH